MATTADLIGLFGQDPQALQQARDMQMAQLDPAQRLYMMGAQTGRSIGQGLGALFGVDVQDPMVKKATQLRALANEFDTTTAEGMMKFAQAAQQIDPRAGALAAQQAQAMMKTQSEIAKNLRERAAADPFQKLVESGKYTPESLSAYQQSGNVQDLKLVEKESKISFGADAERISKALFGTDFNKLSPDQAARVNDEVQKQDLIAKATGANKLSVIQQQESSFAKERGQLQAKTLAETEAQAKASANAVSRLASMEKLNQGKMLTGPMAGTAIGAGQFLSSIGLLSPDSAKTLASSEVYDKLAKDLVMQDLGGKLGAQISNADRDFIEARIPQLRNSQQARNELIAKLKEIHKKNIDYYQRMSKHANTKGNLNDFDFSSGAPDSGPTLGTKENPIKLQ